MREAASRSTPAWRSRRDPALAGRPFAGRAAQRMAGRRPPPVASAEPAPAHRFALLPVVAGGGPDPGAARRAPVQPSAPVVQLEPPESIRKEGVKFKEFTTKSGETGWAAVEGSRATDETFEREALEFERQFGNKAMKNKTALEASNQLSARALDVLWDYAVALEGLGDNLDNFDKVFETYWKKIGASLGESMEKRAGAVGTRPVDVLSVVRDGAKGNVREQMTVVFNFGGVLGRELMQDKGKEELFKRFEARLGDQGALLARHLKSQEGRHLVTESDKGAVGGQTKTRGAREKVEPSERTLEQGEELGLTEREKSHMKLTRKEDVLKWEEGAKFWYVNEANDWVKKVREVSLPLKAGPSGTTDRLMQTRNLLNVSTAEATRAACLAYLLPINAHSLVEILVAAKPYVGGEVVMGPGIYKEIKPFDTEIGQLRSTKTPSEGFWQKVDT